MRCQPSEYRPHREAAQMTSIQKLQQFNEDDPDRRLEFYERAISKSDWKANFLPEVLFTDKANIYINGVANRRNLRYGMMPTRTGWVS